MIFFSVVSLSLALSLCQLAVADLTRDYEKSGIIPDVLDVAPKHLLKVNYNGVAVRFGDELTPKQTKSAPSIRWNLKPSKLYALFMTDPDAPSHANPSLAEFLHWVVVNIPGNDLADGESLAKYIGPSPPEKTGLHRYIFTVYQQPGPLRFEESGWFEQSIDNRKRFSLREFAEKYALGDPVLGNMFVAQYDGTMLSS